MELTLDEKLECVLLHLNDGVPLQTISKERGIDVSRLKYYIRNGEMKLSKRKKKLGLLQDESKQVLSFIF